MSRNRWFLVVISLWFLLLAVIAFYADAEYQDYLHKKCLWDCRMSLLNTTCVC